MFPPSKIILQLLINEELLVAADSTETDWKGFIGYLPNDPDSAACIYDTEGVMDGRLMKTGFRIIHPGFQVVVRGKGFAATYARAQQIALAFDAVSNTPVVVEENLYFINNITRTSPVLHLGRETEGSRNRHVFSVNAILTMVQGSDEWDFLLVQSSNGPEVLLVRNDEGVREVLLVRKE